jgi:hypothetical protein
MCGWRSWCWPPYSSSWPTSIGLLNPVGCVLAIVFGVSLGGAAAVRPVAALRLVVR